VSSTSRLRVPKILVPLMIPMVGVTMKTMSPV